MSKPKYWWYFTIKEVAGASLRGQIPDIIPVGEIINQAVKTAYSSTESLRDGKLRVKAIIRLLKERDKTTGGVALELHSSERQVVYWISDFVHTVAAEMGIDATAPARKKDESNDAPALSESFNPYQGTGYGTFSRTGQSVQERYVSYQEGSDSNNEFV